MSTVSKASVRTPPKSTFSQPILPSLEGLIALRNAMMQDTNSWDAEDLKWVDNEINVVQEALAEAARVAKEREESARVAREEALKAAREEKIRQANTLKETHKSRSQVLDAVNQQYGIFNSSAPLRDYFKSKQAKILESFHEVAQEVVGEPLDLTTTSSTVIPLQPSPTKSSVSVASSRASSKAPPLSQVGGRNDQQDDRMSSVSKVSSSSAGGVSAGGGVGVGPGSTVSSVSSVTKRRPASSQVSHASKISTPPMIPHHQEEEETRSIVLPEVFDEGVQEENHQHQRPVVTSLGVLPSQIDRLSQVSRNSRVSTNSYRSISSVQA